jgi:hypothetical protein
MDLSALLRRRTWSSAVYFQDRLELPPHGRPAHLLGSKRLLRGPAHVHTQADPFLFEQNGALYLFIEKQRREEPGWIEAFRVHSETLEPLGPVLREPFHLSYPSVVRIGADIFLLPESEAAGEVRLYRFGAFPTGPQFFRTLVRGRYLDPSLVQVAGTWYLFATLDGALELFFTDDPLNGEFVRHPSSPLTRDPRFARCGGIPFHWNGRLLRPAQNCAEIYGGNLSLMHVTRISPDEYREDLAEPDIVDTSRGWNRQGGHHLSVAELADGVAVAVDGQAWDYYIHPVVARLFRLFGR